MLESTLEHNICTDSPFSISEVKNCIKELNSGKSAGPDSISNEIIKCSSIVTVTAIVKLFNLILSSGIYPTSWRKAFIVLIHKSGDKEDICNYRGISILNCLAKLYSSILNKRLINIMKISSPVINLDFVQITEHLIVYLCLSL